MIPFLATLTALFALTILNPHAGDFKLPVMWDKDFTISVAHHGSMSGGATDIKFTYDSCVYITGSRGEKAKAKIYLMTEKDRVAILKKLRDLKVDKIDTNKEMMAVKDGWSQSICFGIHCIEGGPSVRLDESDKNSFLTAYSYLEEFAIAKAKK